MGADLPIAFCCNGTMLPGLHATLGSLTRRLGRREEVSLNLFISELDTASCDDLRKTVEEAGGVGALRFHEADLSGFADLRSLHGDRTTYLRLDLPQLLPEAERVLYLDADMVVETDVCALFGCDLGDAPLGAVSGETVLWSIDREFYGRAGLMDEDLCFNAGVLLLNAAVWRRAGLTARAFAFGRAHGAALRSHDQTILNALFSRSFYRLPERFNIIVAPETKGLDAAEGIYHFMGSPKPWDPLGNFYHGNWRLWKRAVGPTRFAWSGFLSRYGRAYLRRAWTLRFSYLRVLKRKLQGVLFGKGSSL